MAEEDQAERELFLEGSIAVLYRVDSSFEEVEPAEAGFARLLEVVGMS